MKKILSLLACVFITGTAHDGYCGLFFDDPIDLEAMKISHMLSKDEIQFLPKGKCVEFVIVETEAKLELVYSTGQRVLSVTQKVWSRQKPLTVQLPDGLDGLQTCRLTGKFRMILAVKEGAEISPNDSAAEAAKKTKVVTGYKLDSKWIFN